MVPRFPSVGKNRSGPAVPNPPAGPADSRDDLAAIEAVLRGDQRRFAELVDRYQRAAWRLAFGLVGNMEDAKELSQNSFVKAYRSLHRFRGQSRFSTWFYRIVVNECRNFQRWKLRRPQTESLFDLLDDSQPVPEGTDPGPNPRDAAERKELSRMISDAIQKLPVQQKIAFVLHRLNGLPLEESARVMGVREGTVKAHLFRAQERLKSILGGPR